MIARLAAVAVVVAVAVGAAGCGGGDPELVGMTRDPAPRVDAVTLPDVANGGSRSSSGRLRTSCSSCTSATRTARTSVQRRWPTCAPRSSELGEEAERIDVAMVTVDPDRDTDVLADYVRGFVADGHAIATDDQAALRSVAEPFGVSYEVFTSPAGDVEVGHSTNLFVVDDTGTLVLTWSFGTSADELAGDLEQLLDEA